MDAQIPPHRSSGSFALIQRIRTRRPSNEADEDVRDAGAHERASDASVGG